MSEIERDMSERDRGQMRMREDQRGERKLVGRNIACLGSMT